MSRMATGSLQGCVVVNLWVVWIIEGGLLSLGLGYSGSVLDFLSTCVVVGEVLGEGVYFRLGVLMVVMGGAGLEEVEGGGMGGSEDGVVGGDGFGRVFFWRGVDVEEEGGLGAADWVLCEGGLESRGFGKEVTVEEDKGGGVLDWLKLVEMEVEGG